MRTNGGMTKEQRAEYMKEYRRYHKGNSVSSDLSDHVFVSLENLPVCEKANPVNEEIIENEPVCCDFFGCGKKLSLAETLCGKLCLKHQGAREDIMNCISV